MKERNWQDAYEPAPTSFTQRMNDTLAQLKEEEKPVKKMSFRAAAILAAALLLALTSTAYALSRFGILDTYTDRVKPLPTAEGLVQQDFAQTGGENEYFTLTIREALSDGYRVRYVYEYKAKSDDVFLYAMDVMGENTVSIGGQAMSLDEIRALRPRFVDVGTPRPVEKADTANNPTSGLSDFGDCYYEDIDTLIVWMEIEAPNTDAVRSYLCGYKPDDGEWSQTELSFRTLNAAEVKTVDVGAVQGEKFEAWNIKLVFSPIYTYAFFDTKLAADVNPDEIFFELLDDQGKRLNVNQGSGTLPDEELRQSWINAMEPLDTVPEEMQLQLYSYGPYEAIEAVTIKVK